MVWHHIVLQTKGNVLRFGSHQIHNSGNVVRLNLQQHYEIHRFYERTNPAVAGSQTLRVREWVGQQSFANQQAFGNAILKAVAGF